MNAQGMRELSSILEHSPNGIVLVDEQARIQYVNPAFRRMFFTGDGDMAKRRASEVLGSDWFEQVIGENKVLSVRGRIAEQDFHYRATLFRIQGENRCCGIFIDISEEERARTELSKLKEEMLARAQEVISRQMQTAQEIAGLLGETTADTKVLLTKLADLFRREDTR